MITFEIEHVNVDALIKLQQEGKAVHPDPQTLAMIQDKGLQKLFYAAHKIPMAEFQFFDVTEEIREAVAHGELAVPFVQKSRTDGYDGKGVAVIQTTEDLENLLDGPSMVERTVNIDKELAVIVARNTKGEVSCFPPVEMEFNEKANLVEQLICPASIGKTTEEKAYALAKKVVECFGAVGIFAVEMFVDKAGNVLVNEVAPRPHNSGHHTIESVITSQYEQHLRAIFGFPLGSTHVKLPSVMINLLGEPEYKGKVKYEGLTESMQLEGVKVHIYGKKDTAPFRKMGHATVLASSIEKAKEQASKVKQLLKVKSW